MFDRDNIRFTSYLNYLRSGEECNWASCDDGNSVLFAECGMKFRMNDLNLLLNHGWDIVYVEHAKIFQGQVKVIVQKLCSGELHEIELKDLSNPRIDFWKFIASHTAPHTLEEPQSMSMKPEMGSTSYPNFGYQPFPPYSYTGGYQPWLNPMTPGYQFNEQHPNPFMPKQPVCKCQSCKNYLPKDFDVDEFDDDEDYMEDEEFSEAKNDNEAKENTKSWDADKERRKFWNMVLSNHNSSLRFRPYSDRSNATDDGLWNGVSYMNLDKLVRHGFKPLKVFPVDDQKWCLLVCRNEFIMPDYILTGPEITTANPIDVFGLEILQFLHSKGIDDNEL